MSVLMASQLMAHKNDFPPGSLAPEFPGLLEFLLDPMHLGVAAAFVVIVGMVVMTSVLRGRKATDVTLEDLVETADEPPGVSAPQGQ